MENRTPKIVLKHSRIEINRYHWGDAPQLEYFFSVYDRVRHNNFIKGIWYDDKKEILYLPRGMDLATLSNSFASSPVIDTYCDPFVITKQIPIRYLAKDKRQFEILKFIVGRDNYAYTRTRSQIAINSTTGSGKTFVTIGSICFMGARAMIITSNIEWLEQWKAKIFEYTNLTENDIYMIVGASSIDKLFYRDPMQYQIFLCSHATIQSYAKAKGWEKIDELFKSLKIYMKVYDEAHLYFDNMTQIDYHTNTAKTVYLTATPGKSDRQENIIYKEYFRNIPSIELRLESDNHVNYIGIFFNSNPDAYQISSFSKGQYNFERSTYTRYLVEQENFIKLLVILVDMCLKMDGKILIYIGVNEAINRVYQYMIQYFPFLEGHIGIYNSETPKDIKATMLSKKFILSTTKSAGTAKDIPYLCCNIVLAEPFKSEITARQTLGRCRADNTIYIDCVDNSVQKTKKYYRDKKTIFLEYAKSCKETYIRDDDLDVRYNEVIAKYSNLSSINVQIFDE